MVKLGEKGWARPYQGELIQFFRDGGREACEIWHRKAGKDRVATFIEAVLALTTPGLYWHALPKYEDARKVIWDAIMPDGRKLIDWAFPREIVAKKLDHEMKIELVSGSIWQPVGADNYNSLVGAFPRHVTWSEYALMHPNARQFLRPALALNQGTELIITTPRGYNHAFDAFELAKQKKGAHWSLLSVDDTKVLSKEILAEERKGMPDELFRQEYYCFKPDAMVVCADKARPISEIVAGDVVLTHTGRFRRVERVMSRMYGGDLLRVSSYGARDLVCTPEHPLYVCDAASQSYQWKAAHNVVEGDWLVSPRMDVSQKPLISRSLAVIIAWFACEGCVSGNAVTFSIGAHEPENVKNLRDALSAEGYQNTETKNDGVVVVQVNAVGLADFLVSQCGSLSHHKRLPLGLLRGNEEVVWETLMRGDGCIYEREGRTPRFVYASVSEGLIQQVQVVGAALGYRGSYTVRPPFVAKLADGREIVGGVAYSLQMGKATRYATRFTDRTRTAKNGTLGRVFKIERESYVGPVHNIKVAGDNSYVVNGRAVHNCDFSAANVGSILGRYVEQAEKQGRISDEWEIDKDGAEVEISSDIGFRDTASWWFWQPRYDGFGCIDYDEDHGLDAGDWIKRLREKKYKIGKIWLPHDAVNKSFGWKRSPVEQFQQAFGWGKIGVVPRVKQTQDRINAARLVMPLTYFHKTRCAIGLASLRSWAYDYDEERRTYSKEPLHDWASNGGDAYSYGAQIMQKRRRPEMMKRRPPGPKYMTYDWLIEQGDKAGGVGSYRIE